MKIEHYLTILLTLLGFLLGMLAREVKNSNDYYSVILYDEYCEVDARKLAAREGIWRLSSLDSTDYSAAYLLELSKLPTIVKVEK